MPSDAPRWEPPAYFVTTFRGLVFSWFAVAAMWVGIMGGETLTCDGTPARWHCERRREPLLGRAVDLVLGTDMLSGPNRWTKTRMTQRRGEYWAVIKTDSGDLMLPAQPSEERAEADRKTWMRWAKSPRGTLTLESPTANRFRFLVWGCTALVLAGTVCTAWVHLRPRAPQAGKVSKRRGSP